LQVKDVISLTTPLSWEFTVMIVQI